MKYEITLDYEFIIKTDGSRFPEEKLLFAVIHRAYRDVVIGVRQIENDLKKKELYYFETALRYIFDIEMPSEYSIHTHLEALYENHEIVYNRLRMRVIDLLRGLNFPTIKKYEDYLKEY